VLEEMIEQGRMPWRAGDSTKRGGTLSIASL
jgi:hypothetical protein